MADNEIAELKSKIATLEQKIDKQIEDFNLLKSDLISTKEILSSAVDSINSIQNNGLSGKVKKIDNNLLMQNLRIKKLERANG